MIMFCSTWHVLLCSEYFHSMPNCSFDDNEALLTHYFGGSVYMLVWWDLRRSKYAKPGDQFPMSRHTKSQCYPRIMIFFLIFYVIGHATRSVDNLWIMLGEKCNHPCLYIRIFTVNGGLFVVSCARKGKLYTQMHIVFLIMERFPSI